MKNVRAWMWRVGGLFGRKRREQELAEEMNTHLQLHIADNLRAGMSADEARRQAMIKFGGLESLKEEYREQRGLPLLETLLQDVRYALRGLRRSPGFAITAVLTLALGIGATTTVFSIVNAILLQPLRYGNPDRLGLVWMTKPVGSRIASGNPGQDVYLDWRERAKSFTQLGAVADTGFDLRGNPPVRIGAVEATASFFAAVEVHPALGRVFSEEEARNGARVLVMSHSLWKNHFASDPGILGKTIVLSGAPWTVIGVMPADFSFIRNHDLWVPMELAADRKQHHNSLMVVGRLRAGVTLQQANAEMDTIQREVARELPDVAASGFTSARLMPLRQMMMYRDQSQMLAVLLGAVGIVLLIACANVANLLLARGTTRQKEIAMRLSLGADRKRMLRQLLVEAGVLAVLGAAAGLILSAWAVSYVAALPFLVKPGMARVAIDPAVLAFVAAMTMLTLLVSGLMPAWQTSQVSPLESLKTTTPGSIGSARHQRVRSMLVVAQIALSVVLLSSAGMLVRRFIGLLGVDPGFDPSSMLTMEVSRSREKSPGEVRNFYDQALARVRALPGVQSADVATTIPMEGWNYGTPFRLPEQPKEVLNRQFGNLNVVSATYFQTLRLPILRGRAFTAEDTATASPVVIIDQHLARRYFNNEDPVGKTLIVADPFNYSVETPRQVIGIAADVKDSGIEENASDDVYLPFAQNPVPWEYLVVRGGGRDPMSLLPAVRAAIGAVDKDQPLEDVATMQERLDDSLSPARFAASLMGGFALLSLGLAAIGIYGVIAYTTGQRTPEFGLRMALGAEPRSLLGLVLRGGLKMVLAGGIAGFLGALVVVRLLSSQVYGINPYDPLALSVALALIVVTAIAAMLLPARKATAVDPMVALRYE